MDKSLPPRLGLLAALGQPSRHRIAVALATGPRCVTDLAALIGLSQSCTTRHVQALERAGCVHVARDGKRVRIRLRGESAEVRALLAWLTGGVPAAAPARDDSAVEANGAGARAVPRRTRRIASTAAQVRPPRTARPATAQERADSGKSPSESEPGQPVASTPVARRTEQLEDYLL